MNAKATTTLLEGYTQELRRGVIVMAVLSQLDELEYGYSLITRLAELGVKEEFALKIAGLLEAPITQPEDAIPS